MTADGHLHLLQARPITTIGPDRGTVFGPGPVAESFPAPLAPLEQDLWLSPMRDGLRAALRLTGSMPARALDRSPIVVAVDGMAAADLLALGVDPAGGGILRRLDPRPPARRLRAAWRVGRLRSAFVELATDLIGRVDADLSAVPALDELANHELVAILRNGRRTLASLHGHEAIAGLLIPSSGGRIRHGCITGTVSRRPGPGRGRADGRADRARSGGAGPARAQHRGRERHRRAGPGRGAVASTGGGPRRSRPGRRRPRSAAPAGAVAAGADRPHGVGARPPPRRRRGASVTRVGAAPHARRAGTCRSVAHPAGRSRRSPRAHRVVPPRPVPPRRRRHGLGGRRSVRPPSSSGGRPRRGRRRQRRHGVRNRRRPARSAGASSSIATCPSAPCWWSATSTHVSLRSSPGWAALVAETGSALSHLAILAREYRVPTVVGVAGCDLAVPRRSDRHRRRQRRHASTSIDRRRLRRDTGSTAASP